MRGMFLIVEAVRQLRGEGTARQAADVEVALCHGTGGMLSTGATSCWRKADERAIVSPHQPAPLPEGAEAASRR